MNIYCPHSCSLYSSVWSACIEFPYADTVYDSAYTHLSVRSCKGTGQQFCSQKYSIFLYMCVCAVCVCVRLHMTLFACQGDLAGILAIFVEDADWEN